LSERQVVVADIDVIDGWRLTLLARQILEIGLIDGPDGFA
jgi:hypothetical protein